MLVSTKGRYALRVMVDLAEHQAAGRIPLKEIAARQGISEKYLENILATLVRANMLSGMRGKGGGYVAHAPARAVHGGRDLAPDPRAAWRRSPAWMATARVARVRMSAPRSTCGRTWTSLSTTTSTV